MFVMIPASVHVTGRPFMQISHVRFGLAFEDVEGVIAVIGMLIMHGSMDHGLGAH